MTSTKTARVLVVEDHPRMRSILRSALRSIMPCDVVEAKDGLDALELVRNERIDLMVLDLELPLMGGLEVVNLLRRAPDSPAPMLPIVILSAHNTKAKVIECRDAGVNAFVAKPFSVKSLIAAVGKTLDDRRGFVRAHHFVGPDRRRAETPGFAGPFRRATD